MSSLSRAVLTEGEWMRFRENRALDLSWLTLELCRSDFDFDVRQSTLAGAHCGYGGGANAGDAIVSRGCSLLGRPFSAGVGFGVGNDARCAGRAR